MPSPSPLSLSLFLAVVAGFCWAAVWGVSRSAPAVSRGRHTAVAIAVIVGWVGLSSVPAGFGLVTAERALPLVPLQMAGMLLCVVVLAASPLGKRFARKLPLAFLVGIQGLRFPLEIVLHWWVEEGVAPPQMTWTGQNIDIIAGVVCLVAVPFVARSRAVAWGTQIVGIALLANVFRVVALSVPTPLQRFEDPLLLPFHVPTVWIASVCVMGAVLAHILTVRKLLQREESG